MEPKELKKLVDELGPLEAEYAPFALKKKRIDELRRVLRQSIDAPADQSLVIQGKEYSAMVGACEIERKIVSLSKVLKLAGRAAFMRAVSMTLKNFETLIPDNQRAGLVSTERTGPRDVKTYKNAA